MKRETIDKTLHAQKERECRPSFHRKYFHKFDHF